MSIKDRLRETGTGPSPSELLIFYLKKRLDSSLRLRPIKAERLPVLYPNSVTIYDPENQKALKDVIFQLGQAGLTRPAQEFAGVLRVDSSLADQRRQFILSQMEVTHEGQEDGIVQTDMDILSACSLIWHSHAPAHAYDFHSATNLEDILTAIDQSPWIDNKGKPNKNLRIFAIVSVRTVFQEGKKYITEMPLHVYVLSISDMLAYFQDENSKPHELKGLSLLMPPIDLRSLVT